MLKPSHGRRCGSAQRGLSLVELMVGVVIGLFVVAAAAMVVSSQLADTRRLLTETQIQQDLRAAADIITRELRRAGALNALAVNTVWQAGASAMPNSYAGVAPVSSAAGQVDYSYYRNSTTQGPYGFKLEDGVIKTLFAASGWQELTDSRTVRITTFTVTPRNGDPFQLPCPLECSGGGTACWPTIGVREFVVDITGQAVSDSTVQRSLRTVVRLRNDQVSFNDPLNPTRICPQ